MNASTYVASLLDRYWGLRTKSNVHLGFCRDMILASRSDSKDGLSDIEIVFKKFQWRCQPQFLDRLTSATRKHENLIKNRNNSHTIGNITSTYLWFLRHTVPLYIHPPGWADDPIFGHFTVLVTIWFLDLLVRCEIFAREEEGEQEKEWRRRSWSVYFLSRRHTIKFKRARDPRQG